MEIGIAVLTNSQDHRLQGDLALSILGDLVAEPGQYRDRLSSLTPRPEVADPNTSFEPPATMAALIAGAGMPPTGDEQIRWNTYAASYRARSWGVIDPSGPAGRFLVDGGVPYLESSETGSVVRHRLVEIEPDLFLADNGETLDLRSAVPTWRNIRLVRVGGPAPWQWAVLAAAAFGAVVWLVGAISRTLRRGRFRSPASLAARTRLWITFGAAVATSTALLILGSVGLVAAMPGLVDSGFLGWLDLPLIQRFAFHVPLAVAIFGAGSVAVAAAGWIGRWWPRAVRLQYAVLAVSVVALVAQLAAWRLIGWGA